MTRIRYYIFAIRWLYTHRSWHSTRQKYKALDRAWMQYADGKGIV